MNIDDLDVDSYLSLVTGCEPISKMVETILKVNDYQPYLSNDLFYGLATTYAGLNDIDLKVDFLNYDDVLEENESLNNYLEHTTKDLDSVAIFLRQLGQYRLFTPEEEIEIFKRYENSEGFEKEEIAKAITNHNLRLVSLSFFHNLL